MEQVLYQLPEDWKWEILTDVTQFIGGSQPPKSEFSDKVKDGYVRLIQIRDYKTDAHIVYVDRNSTKKFCNRDDVMIGRYGPPVFQILRGLEGAYNVALMKAVPDEKVVSKDYLFAFLQSSPIQSYIVGLSQRAAGQSGVNKKALENYSIPIPPIQEQKRIVEKLDALLTRIDTAIEHLQESITLADSLFESSQSEIFNDVLTKYQHSTIDEICTVTSSKRIFKADYVESGIPFYRTKEIVDLSKERDLSTELFIDKDMYLEISDKFGVPKKGDLLFSAVGTIGVMWIVDEREFYFKDGNLLWLKDMNGVIPEYLKSAISAVLTEKIKDRSQGAAYKAISITNLKAFEIPLPSIEEQKLTVAKIEHISSLTKKTKQEIRLQINDLQKLKASILDSAFKGEL
ncbi:MAG: restriction endonuclease subunit S [Acinetobacter sp.]|uniref:restriction endonuclease subunit S n=1 Tax=Acinetobacter sp. TaxID=472 RepID=UPI00258D8083|nr:restriction endonuclease subunit S [Acinetobacter sp.]MCE1272719.1 restriction endonuclease subunit S [Acinetobacter sp.]